MLTGQYTIYVDGMGGVIIPPELREVITMIQEDDSLVCTKSKPYLINNVVHRGIAIYSYKELKAVENRILHHDLLNESEIKSAMNLLIAPAEPVAINGKWKIILPAHLRHYCGLNFKQQIVLVGALNRIEIWSHDSWAEIEPLVNDTLKHRPE